MFLEIKDLKKSFGTAENRTEVLKGIDFSVEKGQICVLLGPSGSGKSTLLNIIGGIDQADEGYVSINGEKTADMKEKRLTQYRRRHLGYVFQMGISERYPPIRGLRHRSDKSLAEVDFELTFFHG